MQLPNTMVRGKDGNLHYVEILSAPYYEGKELIGFQGIARDITERKQTEKALREKTEELDQYFNTALGSVRHR